MKAVGKYIVVTPAKESGKTTKGGVFLTEQSREDIRYRKAKVVSIGDTVVAVKKENDIYYDRHAGFNIELNNTVYKVIKEQDVVIIL
jgi:co-chaperonin GroES (HSP10)